MPNKRNNLGLLMKCKCADTYRSESDIESLMDPDILLYFALKYTLHTQILTYE